MGLFGTPQPDIRERQARELVELYDRVSRQDDFEVESAIRFIGAIIEVVDARLKEPMLVAARGLVADEYLIGRRPDFPTLDFRQQSALRSKLKRLELKLEDGGDRVRTLLQNIFASLMVSLPKTQTPSPFTISLMHTVERPGEWISRLYKELFDEQHIDRDILVSMREQMYLNLCFHSDIPPYSDTKRAFKHAVSSDLRPEKLNDVYLSKTPLHALFKTSVPLKFTHEDRFSHTHVVGGSGAGKTSLIERLILYDLQSDDPPTIVVIDPHSDLIRRLLHADLGIEDRIILVDPRDIEHPPALNIFALNKDRLDSYDPAAREQVTAGVIQTFDYLFSGLIGADLTAKQGVFFRYVARLMLALPETMGRNATILDMLKLMSDPAPYAEAIASLPDIPREFFLNDFQSKTFQQTKEQIRYRLQAILENPTMARLFTSPETKVDLFTEMNRGAIILVDTAKDYLKGASDNFGRIFISLVLQAVLERSVIRAEDRKPTFVYIDEAASYFDSNIDDLLTEARKYKCGMVLAHQYLDQASSGLKASLAANTGIKLASGLSAGDARSMAPEMRTTADFILDQPRLQFAAHIRNVTPHAVSIPIVPGALEGQPKLSEEAFEELMATNRRRVSLPRLDTSRPVPSGTEEGPPPAQRPDEDVSREW